eukprot:CAMPEP_0178903460 /NCGR_PEP_ID=MMETSP0786-20121207/5166_1 /TAXON_ID=186022 /ORGANISM="Thalassionema frauenfeldii, Strain CCMP 1798" /LENGTH=226 /DNA_ID=CAMNT_0020574827 /DNA_START=29 /DNA_END=709 /DNA_ORIENTATION=-
MTEPPSPATSSSTKPLFGYWAFRANNRGSVNRYILGWSGVEYEEKRYTSGDEWGADKANLGMDFPNLPYVKNGDFFVTESKVVSAYLCDKFAPDLIGDTPEERARILQIQENLLDDYWKWFSGIFRTDDKESMLTEGLKIMKVAADYLGDDKDWLANGKVSLVDFILFEQMESCHAMAGDDRFETAYPNLKAHHDRVAALPKMAAFLASDKHLAAPFVPPFAKIPF